MADTYLAQAIHATDDTDSAYDTNIKYLFADKQILARILKYTMKEFRDMSIEDIISGIGGNIEVGTRAVDAGLSNLGRIQEERTEDNIPGEGVIYYDIRFTAYHKRSEIKFLVNLEAQRSSDFGSLGYHLENRILFYLSRMISVQKQTEFFHSRYDDMKPVRSIWICMDNREDGDSIEEIGLYRKTVYGREKEPQELPMIKGIIVNIRNGKNSKKSRNALISMLETLVSQTEINQKKQILKDTYGMIMTSQMEGRLQTMCNFSQVIREEATRDGLEQGMKQGVEQGRREAIERMIKKDYSKEQILDLGYTEEDYRKAEEQLLVGV